MIILQNILSNIMKFLLCYKRKKNSKINQNGGGRNREIVEQIENTIKEM